MNVLDPAGPDAGRLAELSWILFIGGGAIFALVLAITFFAMQGSDRSRKRLSGNWLVWTGGIAFPVAVLTGLLVYGLLLMGAESRPAEPDLRVHVEGRQWWWRVSYEEPDGSRLESANEIRIPLGREVEFVLTSPDVIHSFWVPSLGGKLDMIPGRTNRLRLTADRPGVYRGQCAEYCGGPHALMALEVIAMPAGEFDAWRAQASSPVENAPARGGELFLATGCGSCHTVRGTSAAGTIGPDLSRLGERRQLAAARLPMSAENIARFITHGQDIKPGNLMPEFRFLTADETAAIASYLAELK